MNKQKRKLLGALAQLLDDFENQHNIHLAVELIFHDKHGDSPFRAIWGGEWSCYKMKRVRDLTILCPRRLEA